MSDNEEKPASALRSQPPLPMRAWFDRAACDVVNMIQRVLTHETGEPGRTSYLSRDIHWPSFERELAMLAEMLRHRHAAKHAAEREAMLDTRPIVIAKDGPYR